MELKGVFNYTKASGADGTGAILAGADYFFEGGEPWAPYAGGGLGFSIGKGSDALGNIHGGVRYFFTDSFSANIEAKYDFAWNHVGDGILQAAVGLSAYFEL